MILSFYFNYKAELKMNALREREINNNLERRLSEEQKLRGEFLIIYDFSSIKKQPNLHSLQMSQLIKTEA